MQRSLPLLAAVALTAAVASTARADDLQVAADPTPPGQPSPALAAPVPPKVAGATPRPSPPQPILTQNVEQQTEHAFYGWQNILVGELGIAAAFGGAFLGAGEPAALGGLVYLFGSPIVHGVHGGGAPKIFGSLAITIGVPVLGAAIGAGIAEGQGDDAGQGAAIGVLTGCFLAPILDGVALGHERRPVADPKTGSPAPRPAMPMVGFAKTREGFVATVAGQF